MNDISREQTKWAMQAWEHLNQCMNVVLNERNPDPEMVDQLPSGYVDLWRQNHHAPGPGTTRMQDEVINASADLHDSYRRWLDRQKGRDLFLMEGDTKSVQRLLRECRAEPVQAEPGTFAPRSPRMRESLPEGYYLALKAPSDNVVHATLDGIMEERKKEWLEAPKTRKIEKPETGQSGPRRGLYAAMADLLRRNDDPADTLQQQRERERNFLQEHDVQAEAPKSRGSHPAP